MRHKSLLAAFLIMVGFSATPARAEFRGAIGVSALETLFGLTAFRAELGLPFNFSLYGQYDKGQADLEIVEIDYEHEFVGARFYLFPWQDHEGLYLGAGHSDVTGYVDDEDVTGSGNALEIGYTSRWGPFYFSSALRRTDSNGVGFFTYPTSIGLNIGF